MGSYMRKKEDGETRYFIDLDLKSGVILSWDSDQRERLVKQGLAKPLYHRLFITKVQYDKLEKKYSELSKI